MKKFSMKSYRQLLEEHGGATKENLFEIFGKIQDTFGCVGEDVIRDLAAKTDVSEAQIYGALTAYPEIKIHSERPKA